MKFKYLLIASLALSACAREQLDTVQADSTDAEESSASEDAAYQSGLSYILFSDEMIDLVEADLSSGSTTTKSSGLNEALEELGVSSIERLFPDAGEYEPRARRFGLHKWYKLRYDESVSLTKAGESLASIEGVEEVERVQKIKPLTFNDPYFSYQWHYGTADDYYGINLQKAWDEYTVGSDDVIVAIVDGGIQSTHEDLKGTCLSEDEGACSFVSGYDLTPMAHGTHVAGTIGCLNNNNRGLCGIAGGDYKSGIDGVRLLSCMIFVEDGDDTYSGDAASAITWAADHGAVVCNNSWGYDADYNGDGTVSEAEANTYRNSTVPTSVQTAIDYFIEYAGCDNDGNQLEDSPMKGGLVVFAAGNDAIDWGNPAYYEPVLAVGATDENGDQAYFSNYGDWVDIAAPGYWVYSTYTGNQYAGMAGTSMACPHVSGVAALVLAYRGRQGYTPDMLKEAIIGGANYDILDSSTEIGPLLDAYGAITWEDVAGIVPPEISSYGVSACGNVLTFSWEVEADSDGIMADSYITLATTDYDLLGDIDLDNIPSGVTTATLARADSTVGTSLSLQMKDLEFDTPYYVTMVSRHKNGNYSALSEVKSISTTENNPPVFTFSDGDSYSVHAHQSLEVSFTVADPEGYEGISVRISSDTGGAASLSETSDGAYSISINSQGADAGTYSLSLTAEDYHGGVSTYKISYQLLPNHAPTLLSDIPNVIFTSLKDNITLNLYDYFTDEDGETLSCTLSESTSGVVSYTISNQLLLIEAKGYGTVTLTVTATDTLGESTSASFIVLVRSSSAIVDAYPNPVKTTLYIRTGEEALSTGVKLVSETGKEVYSATALTSAFSPLAVDVSSFAAGKYLLYVDYDGNEYELSIVKL